MSTHMSVLPSMPESVDRDPAVAAAWLDVLRGSPEHPRLVDDVRMIVERWPADAALVIRACDALIRMAERIPFDEPSAAAGPARLAVDAVDRCLAAAPTLGTQDSLFGYLHINRANALRLLHAYDEALPAFETALRAQPDNGGWWFNLGLLHKARLAFREGLDANLRARALLGNQKAVLWNLSICATALGEGQTAVESLRCLGHDAKLAPSGMPYVDGLPPVQVRAASIGSGLGPDATVPERAVGFELLWVTPISPCHGVVSSPSFRDASIDYGDVVLWEPVPLGISEHDGRPVPRFALLAVLKKGTEHRFRYVALEQEPEQVAALARDLPENCQLFVHDERVEMLCTRCASGEHMRKHQHSSAEPHRLSYGKLVVAGGLDLSAFRADLDALVRRNTGVQIVVPGLFEALGDSAAAGQAHQMWRGLERTSAKRPGA